MKLCVLLFCGFLLIGCGDYPEDNVDYPACRERTTALIASSYPDPADLETALLAACRV